MAHLSFSSRTNGEPTFAEVLARLSPSDIVIVEGYKREPIPKIEARRIAAAKSDPLTQEDATVIAVAADHPADGDGRPVFDLNDSGYLRLHHQTVRPQGDVRVVDRAHPRHFT